VIKRALDLNSFDQLATTLTSVALVSIGLPWLFSRIDRFTEHQTEARLAASLRHLDGVYRPPHAPPQSTEARRAGRATQVAAPNEPKDRRDSVASKESERQPEGEGSLIDHISRAIFGGDADKKKVS
jgi:hypothetical protein